MEGTMKSKCMRILWIMVCVPFLLQAKVYDCFTFVDEIDLLKKRFEALNEVVDYFVVLESIETKEGEAKPMHFKENQGHFEEYLSKVIHVIIEQREPKMSVSERELNFRNYLVQALVNCGPSDAIIFSEIGAIPQASAIAKTAAWLAADKKIPDVQSPPLNSMKNKKEYYQKYSRLGAYAFQTDEKCNSCITSYKQLIASDKYDLWEIRNLLPRIPNNG